MANKDASRSITLPAAAVFTTSQYRAIKVDANGRGALCAAGESAIGLLQNTPSAIDEGAAIDFSGVTKAILGGAVTAGDVLTSDANAALVAGTSITNNFAVAIESGVAGDIISVIMQSSIDVPQGATAIAIPIPAMAGIANGDLVTEMLPGFAGRVLAMEFVCTTAVTTAAKATTLNVEIGTTNATGSLVISGTYAVGATERVALTALNTFDEHQKISIEAASTTTFIEGAGVLLLWIDRTADVAANGYAVISVPIPAMSGIANGDLVTTITPGFAGRIYGMEFICTTAVTTAAKTTTLNAEIGAVNTGGTLVVAGTYAVGATQRADLSAPNTFTATDTISIEAAATTSFVEGAGVLLIYIDQIPYSATKDSAVISIPIPAMAGIANGDLVTGITPGFPGRITALEYVNTTAVTTAAKTTSINAEIGTTNCTGTLVVAGTYAVGATELQAVTALNTFTATDTISIEAAATTTFIEGAGVLLIYVDQIYSS
jgi:hypothetical protein